MNMKTNRKPPTTNYSQFVFNNYHRRFRTSTQELRQWYKYIYEFSQINYAFSRRRCPSSIPNAWDDYYASAKCHHPHSWKAHYKCPKQWMKNL